MFGGDIGGHHRFFTTGMIFTTEDVELHRGFYQHRVNFHHRGHGGTQSYFPIHHIYCMLLLCVLRKKSDVVDD